jgi:V-type H+-transporting ATPase subunit C
MQPTQYILVSLPLRIFDDDPMTALAATIGRDNGETLPFPIPSFKIGTLDALVQHADDLAKLNAACEAAIAKVAESLKGILDGDEDKVAQQKVVNDSRLRPPPPRSPRSAGDQIVYRTHGSLPTQFPVE